EFAAMPGGMSFAQVQDAVPHAKNIVADPPRDYGAAAVCEIVAAIDQLPRPTLVTCRGGARSSAAVYVYAGLRSGASAEEVLARADADGAPFAGNDELRGLVVEGLQQPGP